MLHFNRIIKLEQGQEKQLETTRESLILKEEKKNFLNTFRKSTK